MAVSEMNLICELKAVQATKAVSLDMVYKLTLVTDDPKVLALGTLPSDTLFEVTIGAKE